MNYLSLFSGIGGLDLGLDRAGMTCVGQVERDDFCRQILSKHWPEVPKHDDVRTAIEWWDSEPRPRVDAVVGGYPCQPESLAGGRRGTEDERWLWPEMARIIAHLRPRLVIGENVLGHRTSGLRFVLRDLERLGYTATAGTFRACEVGAPHSRPRLFVLAYAHGERIGQCWWVELPESGRPEGHLHHWKTEPEPHRVADGVPRRVDRNRVLGNAVVPAVAEHIGRLALAAAGASHV